MVTLEPEVRLHERGTALFGGPDGTHRTTRGLHACARAWVPVRRARQLRPGGCGCRQPVANASALFYFQYSRAFGAAVGGGQGLTW